VSGTAATEVEEAQSPACRDAVVLGVGLASPVQWAAAVFNRVLTAESVAGMFLSYLFAKFVNYETTSLDEVKAVACWLVRLGLAYSVPVPTFEGYRGVWFEGGRPGHVCPDEASANFYARDIHLSYTVTPIGSVSSTKFKNFEAARAWVRAPVAPVPLKDGSPDPTRRVDTNFVDRPSVFPMTRYYTLQDIGGLRSFQHIVSR